MIETMTNEEKYHFLINQIIHLRKKSVQIIQKQFKNFYLTKLNMKKILLIQNLLQKRNSSIIKIVSIIKSYIIRKKVQNYLSKVKTSFVITNELNMEKNMQLKVFFGNIIKIFNFEYDSFLDKFAIYIPRNKITKTEYQVNFLSNDKIVIDPSYFTSQENGIFVNIINFERIKKEELAKAAENEREKKYILMYLRSQGIKFTEKGVEFEYDDDLKSTATNSPQFDIRKRGRFGSFSMNHRSFKKFGSIKVNNLPKPKSILKLNATENIDPGFRKRRMSGMLNIKKVSFGNVEFGY